MNTIKIQYVHEPTDLQCGQAVLSMITGIHVEEVIQEIGNERETNLKEMKTFLTMKKWWRSKKKFLLI